MDRAVWGIRLLLFLFFALTSSGIRAHTSESLPVMALDSSTYDEGFITDVDALSPEDQALLRKEMSFDIMSATSILSGGAMTWVDAKNRRWTNQFTPRNNSLADYTVAGSPLAATYLLKLCGVKSRSSWRRLATASAFSLGFSTIITQGFKRTVSELRPDQSDSKSFTSGHTAIAFTSATILSREYGHISPWVSVGGYAAATATEVLRSRHNAHWVNDILSGAAVGIVSTNLAYFITDRILGAKDISRVGWKDYNKRVQECLSRQSGITLFCGTEMGGKLINSSDVVSHTADTDYHLQALTGISTGLDASWFFNRHFALEAVGRMNDVLTRVKTPSLSPNFEGAHLYQYRCDLAFKYSTPFVVPFIGRYLPPLCVSVRALAGVRYNQSATLCQLSSSGSTPFATIPSATHFETGIGCDFTLINGPHFAGGMTFDYVRAFTNILPNRYSLGSTWRVLF